MSCRARDWAWSRRGLTPALRCILLALAEHADEQGRCWPSLARLAALAEVDRRTVTRGLAALEARALLTRERTTGQSTSYALAIGEPGVSCVVIAGARISRRHGLSSQHTVSPHLAFRSQL